MKISERFARRHETEKHSFGFDLDATEEFILYRCGPELMAVIGEVFNRLREAEAEIADHQTLTTAEQTVRVLRERIAALERVREAAVCPKCYRRSPGETYDRRVATNVGICRNRFHAALAALDSSPMDPRD